MIAYDDVYNDQKHNVNMQYNGMENQFRYFYPSLNKHNSSNYYVANASKTQWQFKCDFYDAYGRSLPDSCRS